MKLHMPVAALLAVALLPVATAMGAPDREAALLAEGDKVTWTSEVQAGAVYTSDVANRVPACSAVFACDATLIQTNRYGNLQVDVVGKGVNGQDTLRDIDLHVYISNSRGAKGEALMEGTSAAPAESVLIEDVPAGYYLVYVDWYTGAGSFDGTVQLQAPTTPTDTPPAFVPAENPVTTTPPARQASLNSTTPGPFAWAAGPGAGLSDAQGAAGCRTVNCDHTLFKVDEAGTLTFTSGTATPSMVDADLHLYSSDVNGAEYDEVGAATNFTPSETLVVDVEPGYYLLMIAYSGVGTIDATAAWAPPPPPEEEEVPAE